MGLLKKDHLRAILACPGVMDAWTSANGSPVSGSDIDRLFTKFIPMQRNILKEYAKLIPGLLETVKYLHDHGIKIRLNHRLPQHNDGSACSGEWNSLPGNEWVRPVAATQGSRFSEVVQNAGCKLPFGVGWTAFSAIFLALGIVTYSNDRRGVELDLASTVEKGVSVDRISSKAIG